MSDQEHDSHPGHAVEFELDGARYKSPHHQIGASDVLRLAGLDPAQHDLLQVLGPRVEHRFDDTDVIDLDKCDKFVSLYNGPTPVA